MTEGFDVALEMSGQAAALRGLLPAMAHGGRIALLGIQTGEVPIDFTPIVFNMLTLKGIYGREMYETWYQMSVMVQSGLDITPGDHAPVLVPRLRGGVRGRRLGRAPAR